MTRPIFLSDPTQALDANILKEKDLCVTGYGLAKFKGPTSTCEPIETHLGVCSSLAQAEGGNPAWLEGGWLYYPYGW